jgi:hypothetical protein
MTEVNAELPVVFVKPPYAIDVSKAAGDATLDNFGVAYFLLDGQKYLAGKVALLFLRRFASLELQRTIMQQQKDHQEEIMQQQKQHQQEMVKCQQQNTLTLQSAMRREEIQMLEVDIDNNMLNKKQFSKELGVLRQQFNNHCKQNGDNSKQDPKVRLKAHKARTTSTVMEMRASTHRPS